MKRAIYIFLFSLFSFSCLAQKALTADSLAKGVTDFSLEVGELKRDNSDLRKDLVRANEKLNDYTDMFKQQWTFFWGATVFIGVLIALIGFISFNRYIRTIHQHSIMIQDLKQEFLEEKRHLNDVKKNFENNAAESLHFIKFCTRRIAELQLYVQGQLPSSEFFRIKQISDTIESAYKALRANPDDIMLVSFLENSIGMSYDAMPIIKAFVNKRDEERAGHRFNGEEFGISDLRKILKEISENGFGTSREFALNASRNLEEEIAVTLRYNPPYRGQGAQN